jgi:hypothetical protein
MLLFSTNYSNVLVKIVLQVLRHAAVARAGSCCSHLAPGAYAEAVQLGTLLSVAAAAAVGPVDYVS